MPVELEFVEDHCTARQPGGKPIGVMAKKKARALTMALKTPVRYEGLIEEDHWKVKIKELEENPRPIEVMLDILVYGSPQLGDTLARQLSSQGLYLQHPHQANTCIPYQNPQFLDLPEVSIAETAGSDLLLGYLTPDPTPTPSESQFWEGLENTLIDFTSILDMLPQHNYLQAVNTDYRVRTKLLPHQQKALDFILRRESADVPDTRSLWEPIETEEGLIRYRHAITGAKYAAQEDILGGILADEMGLGKSLTMLSAMIMSSGLAAEYSLGSHLPGQSCAAQRQLKATLVVVPSELLMSNWVEEMEKHLLKGSTKYYKYHGEDRHTAATTLQDCDIVFTTYGTIISDASRRKGILGDFKWYRLVLDEAHVIRNSSTKQFQAIANISAHIRWCITGTPVQNKLEDLGSLVRFLKVPELEDMSTFRRHIIGNAKSMRESLEHNYENLKYLLGSICLRRSKTVLDLHGLESEVCRLHFTAAESAEYHRLKLALEQCFKAARHGKKPKGKLFKNILDAWLQLRLFCNHGSTYTTIHRRTEEEILALSQQTGENRCVFCSCDIVSIEQDDKGCWVQITECQKFICVGCAPRYRAELNRHSRHGRKICSLCQGEHKERPLEASQAQTTDAPFKEDQRPSKLIKLTENLRQYQHAGKSIVFSFWKKTLDIVQDMLVNQGVSFCRVDGSLSPSKRRTVLKRFQENPSISVLLMTLGTGAVGLNNLSVANRVHLLEPQWNPSVETQAIGRVLRLGQGKQVTIVRYIVNKTIEEVWGYNRALVTLHETCTNNNR
ncbi:hypothetical protein GQ53DRAFT_861762 [Thozetella sp. PMI_491]|nr:hypothetical protein GQ53DRAFT_861762 [Thozetella sp. PMI_491]